MADTTSTDMIPRAEAERLVADAVAVEQRKRRRLQFALAAVVGLLLVAGGSFAWWRDKQAEARRQEDKRIAAEKLDREERNREAVAIALDRCEQALRADEAQAAATAVQEAERRVAEGGAEELQGRLDRVRADLAMLRKLNEIDDRNWTITGRHLEVAPPPREILKP